MEEYVYIVDSSSDETTVVPHKSPPPEQRNIVHIIITLGLFAIIIGAILANMVDANIEPSDPHPSSINLICSIRRHTELCSTDISSITSHSYLHPEMMFNLTLQLALNELLNISSLFTTLISASSDLQSIYVLNDCVSLFNDAVSQLDRSVNAMSDNADHNNKVLLNEKKVGDLKAWINVAMKDQEMCVDGLEEMRSMVVDKVKVKMKMKRSSEYMSTSLAILDNNNNNHNNKEETIVDRLGRWASFVLRFI